MSEEPPLDRWVRDLHGHRSGRLVAVRYVGLRKRARDHLNTALWECLCDCGNVKVVESLKLINPQGTKSCGCLQREAARRNASKMHLANCKPPGQAAFAQLHRSYRAQAQRRGQEWALTIGECADLFQQPCFYCGSPPAQVVRISPPRTEFDTQTYIYNGLDRLDNACGYRLGNVVPCCKVCNHAKKDMPVDEFLRWARRLGKYQLDR